MSDTASNNMTVQPTHLDEAIRETFTQAIDEALQQRLGQHAHPLNKRDYYGALGKAVMEQITPRWSASKRTIFNSGCRRTYYLSLEYLMGRLLNNALLNLGIKQLADEVLSQHDIDIEEIYAEEADAGLGNGGLGRLAACFMDSCASHALPVTGYGLRYQYGMFKQLIKDGCQHEVADDWLEHGYMWEVKRAEYTYVVKFGGHVESIDGEDGRPHYQWLDADEVLAVPYDVPVPGYANDVVLTLRLWSAESKQGFDLEAFNQGDFRSAHQNIRRARDITKVLYPNDDNYAGKELRLRQQYLLVSASLQDVVQKWRLHNGEDFSQFGEQRRYQLNDTHPALAIAEMMRILLDEHGLTWQQAWQITRSSMAYTNHTLLPEALEVWPADLLQSLLPRLYDIIDEIDRRLVVEIRSRWPLDHSKVEHMRIMPRHTPNQVRMANLAISGSFSVNGVAAIHSQLLQDDLFADFAGLWPKKFNNKTNGISQRRWLAACNPLLNKLISSRIGNTWIDDLEQLVQLEQFADDKEFQLEWRNVRQQNKQRLSHYLMTQHSIEFPKTMMLDAQVKRIHEYKRQLLNTLHAIHLYHTLKNDSGSRDAIVPRTILMAGKAAPGYWMAKNIIQFFNQVAAVVNNDADTRDHLRLIFVPNYNVSAMEMICPATDLSEQISTAGKEASGTGNMKLMLNGALTIGTLDGANIEILEAVGEDNFFQFGHDVEQVRALLRNYDPVAFIHADERLANVLEQIRSGIFGDAMGDTVQAILQAVENPHDPWMTAADFSSYVEAQNDANGIFRDDSKWTRMSIVNTARAGRFSSDRTIAEYNRDIWQLAPMQLPAKST